MKQSLNFDENGQIDSDNEEAPVIQSAPGAPTLHVRKAMKALTVYIEEQLAQNSLDMDPTKNQKKRQVLESVLKTLREQVASKEYNLYSFRKALQQTMEMVSHDGKSFIDKLISFEIFSAPAAFAKLKENFEITSYDDGTIQSVGLTEKGEKTAKSYRKTA